ncbi:hypothetical protein CsSME_00025151 [Camellia sinensis var. sinensis]
MYDVDSNWEWCGPHREKITFHFWGSYSSCCFERSQRNLEEHTTQLGWVGSMWQQLGRNSLHQFACDIYNISEHGIDWSAVRRHSMVV